MAAAEFTSSKVRASSSSSVASSPTRMADVLASVEALYDQGLYSDALQAGADLGPLNRWSGAAGRVMAGRLAVNLGAPRMGRILHWHAAREHPDDARALYYWAMSYWTRFGTPHTWRNFRLRELPAGADPSTQADWLAFKALLLGSLRDFARAEELMICALELEPDSAWLHVELSELLDRQDLHEESLKAAREALELRPYYRPAVQAAGHRLVQLGRDSEALQLLSDAALRLQSGEVWCQLAALQRELKQYDQAWLSLEHAERCWPLAPSDSAHARWLAGERCDVAYFKGDTKQAIELARRVDRPFYKRLIGRLENALAQQAASSVEETPRIQLPVPFVRQFHNTCAPATLSALASYWSRPIPHEQIIASICYEGTRSHDERRWAEENGFYAREFRITESTAQQLIRHGIPMTLNTVDPGSAHLQAIVGFDNHRGTFLVQDPSERHIGEITCDTFLEHYASTGPRGMLIIPADQRARTESIELPDVQLYDLNHTADLALGTHDRGAAVAAVDQMIELDAEHRLTLQARLMLARYDANPQDQLLLADRLLLLFPHDANLLLLKCGLLGELGSRQDRISLLRTAAEGASSHPIFLTRLAAELLDDARDHAEAWQCLKRALRRNASDVRALTLMADMLWNERRREEALDYYRIAASLAERDESQAQRYFAAARYAHLTNVALDWLRDRCQRLGHRSSLPGRTLARALEQLNRTPEALAVLDMTARQHPDDSELLIHAALAYGHTNQHDRAAEYLQSASRHCGQVTLDRAKAILAHYRGELARARDLYLQALSGDPLDMNLREQVLQLDMDLDGPIVAEKRLREVVDQYPHSFSLRVLLIQWLRQHKLADVQSELDRFLQLHPRDAWARREAALAASASRDLERALQECVLAIELDPNNDVGHFIHGRVLEQLGRRGAAQIAYRRSIELNVDHESAMAALIETCDRPADRQQQLQFMLDQLRKQTTYGEGIIAYYEVASGRIEPQLLLQQLEEARAHRPDLWQSWAVVGWQHLAMNQRCEAVAVALEATERFPLTPRAWLNLALAYRRNGDHEQEKAALDRARSINPQWSEVTNELAELYMQREQYDDAEKILREVLAADPRSPSSLANLADCLARRNDKPAALVEISKACVLAENFPWAWDNLLNWSVELDQGQTAIATAQAAIDARPHDARRYLRMAEIYSQLQDAGQALQFIEQSLERNPRSIDAHALKAYCLGQLHRWDDALRACSPELFGEEVPVKLKRHRAVLLNRKGQMSAAFEELQSVLREDADQFDDWRQLADWAEALQRPTDIMVAAENMVRLKPHNAVAHGYLADALLLSGKDRATAKQHLGTAIDLLPSYAFATVRLCELHLEDGQLQEAEEALAIGGPHLSVGLEPALRGRILAARAVKNGFADQDVQLGLQHFVDMLKRPLEDPSPLVRAVDGLDDQFVDRLAIRIQQELTQPNAGTTLDARTVGLAFGRMLARRCGVADRVQRFAELPAGEVWNETIRGCALSLAAFQSDPSHLRTLVDRYRQQLSSSTRTWSAISSAMVSFRLFGDCVRWTKDWRSRTDAAPRQLVDAISSRWELYQLRSADSLIEHALALPADDRTDWVRVFAGLSHLIQGRQSNALEHARGCNIEALGGWYTLAYAILVAGLEAWPNQAGSVTAENAIQSLLPPNFVLPAEQANHSLSRWLLLRVAASVAKAHGRPMRSLWLQLRAVALTWR